MLQLQGSRQLSISLIPHSPQFLLYFITGDGFDGNHIEQSFTTADKDQDNYYDNCAVLKHGAYWYNQCNYSNLNGNYHNEDGGDWTKGFYWYLRNGLKASQMKFRKL